MLKMHKLAALQGAHQGPDGQPESGRAAAAAAALRRPRAAAAPGA